jgi:transcriptional regulator with XRE-family HTH domain
VSTKEQAQGRKQWISYGELLRGVRERANITQAQAANAICVTHHQFAQAELGKGNRSPLKMSSMLVRQLLVKPSGGG